MRVHVVAATLVAGLTATAFAQGAPKVVVGDNPSLSGAPLYVALEKGYYREAGIDVQLEMSGTSSDNSATTARRRRGSFPFPIPEWRAPPRTASAGCPRRDRRPAI